MKSDLSRRDFLKFSASLTAGAGAFPFARAGTRSSSNQVIRVATDSISVYSQPNDESRIQYQHFRDDLVNYYYEVESEYGPDYNPRWYRVWGGYMHSAHLQKVSTILNPVMDTVPEAGILAEVTVPFSQVMWLKGKKYWEPLYRLYYQSLHWVDGKAEGPDGEVWYRIHDELLDNIRYYVRAEHLRQVPFQSFTPLDPDFPDAQKRIEVVLATQTLTAYRGDEIVLKTKISSGVPDYSPAPGSISTNTPPGNYHVYSKMPSKHMGDGKLTSDLEAYELPGVPWSTFFAPHGIAFHGTYWHDNYGVPMSHGCINMTPEEANWIFRWTMPRAIGDKIEQVGNGTRVVVI
jgi:lipoprotein-anchoring transpeptidase ErfK/SrfK